MKVSIEWLKDYTPLELPAKAICDGLTLSGSKVEGCETLGASIQKVVTGRIVDLGRHPNADKLQICQLDVGLADTPRLQIITGAKNVAVGDVVPVALHGASLADGTRINKGKLRGELSEGMLCSIDELGYTPADFPEAAEDGIFILKPDTPPGLDIRDVLGIHDTVIEFEITSNRVDCFAVEGLGREAAVTFDLPFTPRQPSVTAQSPLASADLARIRIEAPDLCNRYCGRVVRDVRIEPSPDWLRRRLRCAGVRPINNIVDITNYVMLELGQPMHAFDLAELAGQQIIVRRARAGEVIRTLDSVDRPLDENMLVIADRDRAVAVAGVMGAENSEITATTTTILFESATFNPQSVRQTARKIGLRTEASARFEKGLDVLNAARALDRACELIEQLACGQVCQGMIDVWPVCPPPVQLRCRPAMINRFLGTSLEPSYMRDILIRLGCEVTPDSADLAASWLVDIPSYRPDLESEADLAEEVARIYGYNKIEPSLLSGKQTTLGGRTPRQRTIEKIKDLLIAQGFFEICTYSFESPRQLDKMNLPADHALRQSVVIINPLGEDYSCMRTSMVPSMLQVAATNWNRSVPAARLFELAYTYQAKSLPMTELPDEVLHLASLVYDSQAPASSGEAFFSLKGAVEELLVHLGISQFRFTRAAARPWLHPGRSAELFISGQLAGWLGVVHPDVAEAFSAPPGAVLLDIEVNQLLAAASDKRTYQPLPRFPAVTRDLALMVDQAVLVADLAGLISAQGGSLLESVTLFDVYQGPQVPAGKKSVAFSLVFRSAEKTLSDEDIQPAVAAVLAALRDQAGAQLRE